ncbi:hypothetical protein IMCC3317_02880 [Kordia antarctica]|uniref:Calx-beta domain-containing protein n=1 Tax=Kordia antarctica TaxID=1218801 RepID=A0A7L4ZDX7_9FLAO|nr:Calx-beta domain-containing protein [Kordia antarctica]QHI34943.1 hypothetical protein IMCC3317_02880 [Kordia antarctica]
MKIKLPIYIFLIFSSISFASENTNLKEKETISVTENSLISEVIIDDMTVWESDGTITVPIHIDVPDSADIVLNITTADGTAISPNDYTAVNTTVTIPAGQTSTQIMVYIVDDTISGEINENFTVNATVISGNTTNSSASGTISLIDQDDSSIDVGDVTVNEDAGTANVPVSIYGVSAFDTVISITTVDNSATNPDDYITTTVTVTIPALQNTVYVNIPIVDDNIGEPTEDFTVYGTATSGNVIGGNASGTITITDNDTPTLNISDEIVNEGAGTAIVEFSITNPSAVDTIVSINLIDDGAASPNDYINTVPFIAIPAGQTSVSLSIPILDDLEDEADEDFTVYGIVQTGNTSNPAATGTVTIIDNDVCTSDPTTDCDGDGVTNGDEQNPPNGGMSTHPEDPCDFNSSDISLVQTGDYLTEDCDGDGTLNNVDCDPFNVSITIGMGDSCDDGNASTLSDFIDENCNCVGAATTDVDGDGISNVQEVLDDTDYNDSCDPIQNAGYTGFDADNVMWQNANCDNDDINNALEITLGSDPYDTNYNTIGGNITLDVNNDGCNGTDDLIFPYTRINISDGSTTDAIFANSSGDYSYYTTTGNFTITPELENPTFFNITPVNASTSFSSINNSVFNQDFCITANGIQNDVEVVIAPIAFARPGFDAEYLLTYKNNGNQTVSGVVDFTYDEAILDFVSSTTMPSSQTTGNLNWNYVDLAPFESRSINIILNVNSPMETPPVNNGDLLIYMATITPLSGDVLPENNQFSYTQTVVGSYDPNDITCVEGSNVDPDEIGEYLHYIINFENTGTFSAQNIVVEMDIDPTQFDINTLKLLSTSHEASVSINDHMVRFIFQNINLAIDGKGNILMKMKSQNTLVENDVVSNQASIFFDYNFPIVTNNAQTTFAILSTQEFEVDNSIILYPNPTKNNIYITANNNIKKIVLYDIQGRILMSKKHNNNAVSLDISNQAQGVYFVKISTEKGVNTEKIIKM